MSFPSKSDLLTIGEIAKRTGLAVSAIRFYEEKGLIPATRAESGNRMFERSVVRRVSFITVCQKLGYTLNEITEQLGKLPSARTPTKKDWQRLAKSFSNDLQNRIQALQQLEKKLDGCIGCGCLSMNACELYNAGDLANKFGAGPRYLLGDKPV